MISTQALNLAKDTRPALQEPNWALGTMANLFRANGDVRKIKAIDKKRGLSGLEIRHLLGAAVHLLPLDRNRMMLMQGNTPENTMLINQRAMKLLKGSRRSRQAPASEIVIIRGEVLVARCEELNLKQVLALTELTF